MRSATASRIAPSARAYQSELADLRAFRPWNKS